jgi:hypothetical protein
MFTSYLFNKSKSKMESSVRYQLIREQWEHMEELNKHFRYQLQKDRDKINHGLAEAAARDAEWPPLPAHVPHAEYVMEEGLISLSDEEIYFYGHCAQGSLDEVTQYVSKRNPSHAVRQYGLEQAAFACQAEIAYFLLKHDTTLHSNAFERHEHSRDTNNRLLYRTIFEDRHGGDLVPLLKVFLESGWHPDQAWYGPGGYISRLAMSKSQSILYRPLLELLLAHGASVNLGTDDRPRHNHGVKIVSLVRQSGQALDRAVRSWDVGLIDFLIDHGANKAYAVPLFGVARYQCSKLPGYTPTPWATRQVVAEHLVSRDLAGVNDVKKIPDKHIIPHIQELEEWTPFSYACSAEDWEFAEWLLEQGADPDLLDGKAFTQQWWSMPYDGPNDPTKVVDLVDRMRKKQRDDDTLQHVVRKGLPLR